MPRYNVTHNNKWACFSSISDGFITPFMDKTDYEEWRKWQYGVSDYKPAEQCNMMTMTEAITSIRIHNTHTETLNQLCGCGIPEDEAETLLYDLETEHYCPIIKENEKYECPNCGSEVEKDQVSCTDDTCELEFVWRR